MQDQINDTRRVLLVDDDPAVLDGLRRTLSRHAQNWDLEFSQGAGDALLSAKLLPFDVIISDIKMPHMHGGALLKRFADKYPRTLRVAFSDKYDALSAYAISDCSHSYIAKPCSAADLYEFVETAYSEHSKILRKCEAALDE